MGLRIINKKQSLAVIEAVFSHLNGPQDGFSTVRDIIYRLCVTAEKQHRGFLGPRGRCGITVPMAAKYWTACYIAQGLAKPDRWTIDDVPSVRFEALLGAAYARKHRAEFLAGFEAANVTLAEFDAVDYAELMK